MIEDLSYLTAIEELRSLYSTPIKDIEARIGADARDNLY